MISRIATKNDIQGILNLQEANLFDNLSEEDRKKGFVTTPFTIKQLDELLVENGLFIVEHEDRIKAYTMAAGWEYFSQWPIFPYMISRLSGMTFNNLTISKTNSFQYGPICVDSALRGSNAFPSLFKEMRVAFSHKYPIGITFINRVNERSYKAHMQKLGMAVIDEFEFSGREYYGLAFDTQKSVLNKVFEKRKSAI
ncbi:MAG: GNAT family acetyltransferase [Desulfobacteraceae bacterium]|nr:GNAT family acetyltransferase [Desulfobacteraceae bacterium]